MENGYRVDVILSEDGKLALSDLPFHAGDAVEVIIIERAISPTGSNPYPLRGTPIRYSDPTEPVAQEDWEAHK